MYLTELKRWFLPTVTRQMRRFAWAKYYQASDKAKKAATGKRKCKKHGSAANNEPQENQGTAKMLEAETLDMNRYREQKDKLEYEAMVRNPETCLLYTSRDGIDQPVILPSAHVAPRFLHRHII